MRRRKQRSIEAFNASFSRLQEFISFESLKQEEWQGDNEPRKTRKGFMVQGDGSPEPF